MIGKSVSYCIADILNGLVKEGDVEKIVGSTGCANEEDWESIKQHYTKYYWRGNPEGGKILDRLIAAGKIEQPRLENPYWCQDLSEWKFWEEEEQCSSVSRIKC